MLKLIAVYDKPEDSAAFDQHYNEVHIPLVKKMPGLQKLEVSRVRGAPGGEPRYYLVAEMYFADRDAIKAALMSPEAMAAREDLQSFAAGKYHMMIATVENP